jgi:hypothetical protein
MAFCGNCGAHSEGAEHFCKNCGHDLSASASAQSAPAPAAVAPPLYPQAAPAYPQAPQAAPYPQYYPQVPVTAPPPPKKMSTPVRLLFGVAGLIILWYGLHSMGVITWPTKMTGVLPVQPTGANAALTQQQSFSSPWSVSNGDVQLTKPAWNNTSNTTVASVDLECDQYDGSNNDLAQKHITLTGTNGASLPPTSTESFDNIDIGQAVQNLSKVNCGIDSATPAQQ